MHSRVKKVFIGTDQARTGTVVFSYLNGGTTAQDALPGEVLVLDKNMNVMTAGKTIADTDKIYIAEILSSTLSYSTASGTALTPYKVLLSDPIYGDQVMQYRGKAYSAKAEQVYTSSYTTQTITAGDEYVLRIVYKDVKQHPGQKTQTYRYITKTSLWVDLVDALAAMVTADTNARVTMTRGSSSTTSTMIITGKAIPECTTALTDIDEFRMVAFEVFFYWIDQTASTYHGLGPFNAVTMTAVPTITGPTYPNGSWEMVRDAEKLAKAQQFGATNKIWFPVREPAFRTVLNSTYETIVIEHNRRYRSPDNDMIRFAKDETQIFVVVPVTTNQLSQIIGVLNPWMASTPGSFTGIHF